MKNLKILVALLLNLSLATSVFAYANLYEYYLDTMGRFPSIEERRPGAESLGIENYTGTAEQNRYLLSVMAGDRIEEGEITVEEIRLGTFNVTGGGTYRLKSSIGTTDTTINLSSFKEPVSDLLYTMTKLNTDKGYGTVDPQTTRSEFVSFTGITQNSDGSAALTSVTRGLTRTPAGSSCTASTTLAQRHPGQSVFILSDSPCFFAEYAVKQNNEAITGNWTVPYPTASSSVASRGYVLDVANSSTTLSFDKTVVAATAGETILKGQFVHLRISDARWYLANASSTNAVNQSLLGIAQGAGSAGEAVSGGVLVKGLDVNQHELTTGANYFLSATNGTTTTATSTRGIGRAVSSSAILFDPFFIEHPTYEEDLAVGQLAFGTQLYATSTTGAVNSNTGVATSTNYLTKLDIPIEKYRTGQILRFTPNIDNTGTTTVALSGRRLTDSNDFTLASTSIVSHRGRQLNEGDLQRGIPTEVVYTGSNFQLMSPSTDGWELVASTTLATAVATTTVPDIPERQFLKVYFFMKQATVGSVQVGFNKATAKNTHYYRTATTTGGDTVSGVGRTPITTSSDDPVFSIINIGQSETNVTNGGWMLMVNTVSGTAGELPQGFNIVSSVGIDNFNNEKITRLVFETTNASNLPVGTHIEVYASPE